MKLTRVELEAAQKALVANCIRPDKAPVSALSNIFSFLNLMNEEIQPYQSIWRGLDLKSLMLPQGLAQFLEPRRVQFDVTNQLQTNLRSKKVWSTKTTKEIEVDNNGVKEKKTISLELETLPNDYSWSDFMQDITRVRVAMKISSAEDSVSVYSAMADVNVLTIVDKLVVNGYVKWDGNVDNAFIPYWLEYFDIGLSSEEYSYEIKPMINLMFTARIKELFSK